MATGYSDGLSRAGEYYRKNGRALDAVRMYWIAPDRKKAQEIIMEAALLIKDMLIE
jgi:hypothetical protein